MTNFRTARVNVLIQLDDGSYLALRAVDADLRIDGPSRRVVDDPFEAGPFREYVTDHGGQFSMSGRLVGDVTRTYAEDDARKAFAAKELPDQRPLEAEIVEG